MNTTTIDRISIGLHTQFVDGMGEKGYSDLIKICHKGRGGHHSPVVSTSVEARVTPIDIRRAPEIDLI